MFVIADNMKCICGVKIEASSIFDEGNKNSDCTYVHEDCMKCYTCEKSLANKLWCFMHKGNPYCDIKCLRMKRKPKLSVCHNCEETLTGDSQVVKIRGHVYHPFCLRCAQCGIQLKAGCRYALNKNNDIVCPKHAKKNDNEGTMKNKIMYRTAITDKQRLSLLYHYTKCKYPSKCVRDQIARKLNLDPMVVKVWFQNIRARNKNARSLIRALEDYD